MYFIQAASTISHQPTFRNKSFSENISALNPASELLSPDYKKYISPVLLRRMSKVLRMSIACSADCLEQSDVKSPDAIIVGTGLGCLDDTEKFLNNFISIKEGLIPPTSFIQSTHNTIAGQISLILQNHNYNMTHTQNTLSFEHALQDAFLCLDEGGKNVLVGAADEHIEILDDIAEELGYKNEQLTSGSSFFILSTEKNKNSKVRVLNAASCGLFNSFLESVNNFFSDNNINSKEIDLILFSTLQEKTKNEITDLFNGKSTVDYEKYSGTYFTNSAFAMHLAIDILESGKNNFNGTTIDMKRILICNNLNSQNLGLIFVEKVEA